MLAREGMELLYRRVFPPTRGPLTLRLGFCGVNAPELIGRPHSSGDATAWTRNLTLAEIRTVDGIEGASDSNLMRDAMGYGRLTPTVQIVDCAWGALAILDSDGWTSPHQWAPEDEDHWDNPRTLDTIEDPPEPWHRHYPGGPVVGFPWQRPRILGYDIPNDGLLPCSKSYWKRLTGEPCGSTGELDYLANFDFVGAVPATLVFLFNDDEEDSRLLASWTTRTSYLWRPGAQLTFSAPPTVRLFADPIWTAEGETGCMTRLACKRILTAMLTDATAWQSLSVYPLVACYASPSPELSWSALSSYTNEDLAPQTCGSWSYVADPNDPYVRSAALMWTNETSSALGPVTALALCGVRSGTTELVAYFTIEAVTLDPADTLAIPNGVRLAVFNRLS